MKEAVQQKRKIAVGIWRDTDNPEILDSIRMAAGFADITIVGSQIDGFHCIDTKGDDEEASRVAVDLVVQGKVDGLVRAQLKDSFTHKIFCEKTGSDEKVKNIPVFIAKDEHWGAVVNPSNYNSLDAAHQQEEAERCARYLKEDLGIEPTIGVMSTRRPTGRVGEFDMLEQIAENCEATAQYLRKKGYDVKEYYIEYEQAVWEKRNMFVAATGMIGNTWMKGLVYLGGWHLVHGPFFDKGAYYDDNPRYNTNWFWPIVSTVAWINRDGGKLLQS